MKNVILLGATGSIGLQAIDVLSQHQDKFCLIGISFGKNKDVAKNIIDNFGSIKKVVSNSDIETEYQNSNCLFFRGNENIKQLISMEEVDIVINAISGFAGLNASVLAIKNSKKLALANKETLVVAGQLIKNLQKEYQTEIIPIDSEHSAILQALRGNDYADIKRLILTASGGSFRDKTREELVNVTLQDALNHPNWLMGMEITIDSATMFNKALEIIEAHYLFDVDYDRIDVLQHNESLDHSMVEFIDGSVMAQLGFPDMRVPIAYALSYPRRLSLKQDQDFLNISQMTFKKIDQERFPAIKIAFAVGKAGGTYPVVLNASKEVANQLFIENKIKFLDIEKIVIDSLKNHQGINNPTLEQIYQIDQETREAIRKVYK